MFRIPVPNPPLDLAKKVEAGAPPRGAQGRKSGLQWHVRHQCRSAAEKQRQLRWPPMAAFVGHASLNSTLPNAIRLEP